jgi:glycosyltransferase involved in cell wall biosynthesis
MKVVVVSHASVNAPHRAAYDRLGRIPDFEVHLVAPESLELGDAGSKTCDPAPEGSAYELHPLPSLFEGSGRFVWYRGLGGLLRHLRPDVVFLEQDPGSLAVIGAALSAPGARCVAFSVENILRNRWLDARRALLGWKPRDLARDLAVASLCSLGAVAAGGLAAISNEAHQVFRDGLGWSKPLRTVPLGTDVERFCHRDASARRAELGLEGDFVVGYFGRLVPEKGVHLLVEALAVLPKNVRLLLDMFANFQPGSYAASLMNRAAELGVRERIVTFDVSHAEVADYMNLCDVVVLPSVTAERWKEQFGRVLPEAMACEVPVVGSRSGNIPDMIGDAGIVVDEGSPDAIAVAILDLMANPVRRRELGMAGRQRVIEHFSIEAQLAEMVSLFDEVLGVGSPRRSTEAAPRSSAPRG